MSSVQDRENGLIKLAKHCGNPMEIMSFRDVDVGVDIFLIEFESLEDARRAMMLMGWAHVEGSNVASVVIPANIFH